MARPRKTRSRTRASRTPVIKQAQIGRFDGELHTVGFSEGDTVQVLLNKAGLSLNSGDHVNDDSGNDIPITSQAKAGQVLFIVTSYKQGLY